MVVSPPPLSRRATLLRPSPLWWVGGGALLAGLLAFVAVAAAGQPAHAMWGLLHGSWLLAVMIGFATMVAHRHGRRRSRGTVRIDPQGLHWNDSLLVHHRDLRAPSTAVSDEPPDGDGGRSARCAASP